MTSEVVAEILATGDVSPATAARLRREYGAALLACVGGVARDEAARAKQTKILNALEANEGLVRQLEGEIAAAIRRARERNSEDPPAWWCADLADNLREGRWLTGVDPDFRAAIGAWLNDAATAAAMVAAASHGGRKPKR